MWPAFKLLVIAIAHFAVAQTVVYGTARTLGKIHLLNGQLGAGAQSSRLFIPSLLSVGDVGYQFAVKGKRCSPEYSAISVGKNALLIMASSYNKPSRAATYMRLNGTFNKFPATVSQVFSVNCSGVISVGPKSGLNFGFDGKYVTNSAVHSAVTLTFVPSEVNSCYFSSDLNGATCDATRAGYPVLTCEPGATLVNGVCTFPSSSKTPLTCAAVPLFQPELASLLTTYCQSFLRINPVFYTVKVAPTVSRLSSTITTTEETSTETTIIVASETTTLTSEFTFTPDATLELATVTSTAYLDNSGYTIFLQRRAAPTSSVRRTVDTPDFLQGFNRADKIQICRCHHLYNFASTITRTRATRPTIVVQMSTITEIISHQATATTSDISTFTETFTETITADTPVITQLTVEFETTNDSCPPGYDATFLCPEGTGAAVGFDDPMYDPNYLTCPVLANDGYSGSCLYWNDDGEPQKSNLTRKIDDGSPEYYTRLATRDCPSWSDYICSQINDSGSVSTLTAIPSDPPTRTDTPASTSVRN